MYGKEPPVKPHHKFFGLIMDKKLTWLNHIKDLRAKSIKTVGALKIMNHSKSATSPPYIIYKEYTNIRKNIRIN